MDDANIISQTKNALPAAPILVNMMQMKERFTTNCFNSFKENNPIQNVLGPEMELNYESLQFLWNILRANNSVYCDKQSKQWRIDDTKKEITLSRVQIKNIYNSSVLGKKRSNRHLIIPDPKEAPDKENCKKIKLSETDNEDHGSEKSNEDVVQDNHENLPKKTFSLAVDRTVLMAKISRLEQYTNTLKHELEQAHALIETYEATFKNRIDFNPDVPKWTMSFFDFIITSLKLQTSATILDMASMKIHANKLLLIFSRNNINATNTDARKLFEVAMCIRKISLHTEYYTRYTAMLAAKFIPHGALNTDIVAMYKFLDAKSVSYIPEYEYIIPICLINQ
jgi:hypothetical protein